eukprot:PITA_22561
MTNVYFPQETTKKIEILNSLSEINRNRLHPLWISGGNFNMIAKLEEKKGGRHTGNREGNHLKDFIQNNWLIDIPSNNGIFTWNNKREGPHQISSRLDKFLLSDNAIHVGGEFLTSILPLSDFNNLISSEWRNFYPPNGSKMSLFQQKLQHLKGKIKHWNHTTFGNIFQAQNALNQEMKNL